MGGAILRIVKRGWGETEAFSEPFSEGGKKPPLSPQKTTTTTKNNNDGGNYFVFCQTVCILCDVLLST